MQTKARLMNVDEFRAFTELEDNRDKNFELRQGEVIEVPSPKKYHAMIVAQIIGLWFMYMKLNNITGTIIGDNLDHHLGNDSVLKPNVGYTSAAREPAIPGYPQVAPDLVVEIESPSNTLEKFKDKMKVYFEHGTQIVWLVYPKSKEIYVYERTNVIGKPKITPLNADDVIDGGNVLPGFSAKVSDFFPDVKLEEDAL